MPKPRQIGAPRFFFLRLALAFGLVIPEGLVARALGFVYGYDLVSILLGWILFFVNLNFAKPLLVALGFSLKSPAQNA